MPLTDRHVQDRLAAALMRLTTMEQRALTQGAAKGGPDLRKLMGDLQRSLTDVQELIGRTEAAQQCAAAATARAELLFDLSPTPTLILDPAGAVLEANPAAARLLNVSKRHLSGKAFPLFLAADRQSFIQQLAALRPEDEAVRWTGMLRPRECSSLRCTLIATTDWDSNRIVMVVPGDLEMGTDVPLEMIHDNGRHEMDSH